MSLKISRHITRKDWMSAPEAVRLFKTLQGKIPNSEPQALFVGGCVRNAILGHNVEDMDIATPLEPDSVIQILEKEEIKTIPTGIDHGTITALIGKNHYEITTLRHDKETDGRRATVAYTDSWKEDAQRRDFTINTLLMDIKGNIYDPLGQGLSDLDAHHVRFVGKPEQRIEEDYLRILRFFRFSALYGNGKYDEDGLRACKKAAQNIKILSRERITQEVFKIIASKEPHDVLDVMFSHNVLKELKSSEYDAQLLKHTCNFQRQYKLESLTTRLFILAGMNLKNIKPMEEFILFPKIVLKDMKSIADALTQHDLSHEQGLCACIYRLGRTATAQTLMIELAQDRITNAYASKALKVIQNWDIPTFPISGNDLMERGIEQGESLGQTLQKIENWWISQNFKPTREACLEQI